VNLTEERFVRERAGLVVHLTARAIWIALTVYAAVNVLGTTVAGLKMRRRMCFALQLLERHSHARTSLRQRSERSTQRTESQKRRKSATLVFALALTGCATPQTRYVETYCLSRTQFNQLKDAEPGKIHNQLNGDASHDVGPLAGSAIRLRAYADGLLQVLGGCIDPNTGASAK
jgi:hypothetical protein